MISHDHRTVFVHIPKCGGQSLETAFLADLGLSWNTRAPLLLRPNDLPALGPPRLAHLRAHDYVGLKYLSQELFDAYFTFTITRDPFARVLSLYNSGKPAGSLTFFVQDVLVGTFETPDARGSRYYFFRPQVDFLTDLAGTPMLDKTYRLEDLDTALDDIRARSGLRAPVPHANRSARRAELSDFSRDDLATIRRLYAADFEMLGYSNTP